MPTLSSRSLMAQVGRKSVKGTANHLLNRHLRNCPPDYNRLCILLNECVDACAHVCVCVYAYSGPHI